MKKKILWALAAVVLCGLLAKPLYYTYRRAEYLRGTPTQAEQTVFAYAREVWIPYGAYPKKMIRFLETNPEALDFVLEYPNRKKADPDISGTPREQVPLFLQWDRRWGYEKYGSDMIAVTGCGPTSLAMAGYYLTGDPKMNPLDIARFAEENGYYKAGYGSSWTLISEGAELLGLEAEELPLVKRKMEAALEEGRPVILAMGPGDFTTAGHYIVLTGTTEAGFQLNDPNSPARSEKIWTYEELEPQIRNIWAISVKP